MYKRASLFWGLVLIILAVLLLINQFGILPGDIWGYFFPFIAILLGIWFIAGAIINSQGKVNGNDLRIPLENAKSSSITLEHGAGNLGIKSGDNPGTVLEGSFEPDVKYNASLVGEELNIKIRSTQVFMNWFPHERLNWELCINPNIPTKL